VKVDVLPSPLGEVNGQCLPSTLAILVQKYFSMQALLKYREACVDNQNWQCKSDRVNLVDRSDR
jgi:hypothetical protein